MLQLSTNEEEVDWMGSDCWFCGRRPPVAGQSCHVRMKKVTGMSGNSLQVLRSSVAVPRCAECKAGHDKVTSLAMKVMFGGALLVFLVVVVWSPFDLPWWGKALLVFFGLVPGATLIGSTNGLPPGQKPESEAEGFKAVEVLKRGGWVKDDQPS